MPEVEKPSPNNPNETTKDGETQQIQPGTGAPDEGTDATPTAPPAGGEPGTTPAGTGDTSGTGR